MRKLAIFLLLLISFNITIMWGQNNDIPTISNIHVVPQNFDIDWAGKWVLVGYSITPDGMQTVEIGVEFNSPEKGQVKFITGKTYTVYPFVVDDFMSRVSINSQNYFYSAHSEDVIMLIEFPTINNKTIYGYYQIYFVIKADVYKEKIEAIATWYSEFFMVH